MENNSGKVAVNCKKTWFKKKYSVGRKESTNDFWVRVWHDQGCTNNIEVGWEERKDQSYREWW